MESCKNGDGRIATKGDECYPCYLKGISFSYGHLRNRLYPGEPVSATERIIREEARKKGEDAVPAEWI